ncbi:MAG: glycosyltransferase [Acidobacteria bacterium]|nr:glycosyltransferase [Acidobacteriota bacterium]
MRICMLVRNRFARDARVLREARSLSGAGHEVTVLALRGPGLPEREDLGGVRVLRAVASGAFAGPTIRSETAVPAGGGGGPSRPARRALPRPAALVWLRDRLISRRFARAASAIPADAYHAHDLNTLWAAWKAARARGARLVYDAHELYPELTGLGRGERARWARLERRLIGRADAVLAPSESRAAHLAGRYGIPVPLVVMNCPAAGPPPDGSRGPLAALRRAGETLLVYAGGYTPNRGLENVVRAIGRAPGCRLAMLGWGPLEPVLRALASAPEIGERVELLPAVAPDEVVASVAAADAGIVSYLPIGLNNALAAPNKIFEYLHAGLAVAGSDLPDIRRVVESHQVGVLFDAADPESISGAFRTLASDPARLVEMRARAAAAAPLYTWEGQERVLLDLYQRLAGRS